MRSRGSCYPTTAQPSAERDLSTRCPAQTEARPRPNSGLTPRPRSKRRMARPAPLPLRRIHGPLLMPVGPRKARSKDKTFRRHRNSQRPEKPPPPAGDCKTRYTTTNDLTTDGGVRSFRGNSAPGQQKAWKLGCYAPTRRRSKRGSSGDRARTSRPNASARDRRSSEAKLFTRRFERLGEDDLDSDCVPITSRQRGPRDHRARGVVHSSSRERSVVWRRGTTIVNPRKAYRQSSAILTNRIAPLRYLSGTFRNAGALQCPAPRRRHRPTSHACHPIPRASPGRLGLARTESSGQFVRNLPRHPRGAKARLLPRARAGIVPTNHAMGEIDRSDGLSRTRMQ